jgi:hypothetical protein
MLHFCRQNMRDLSGGIKESDPDKRARREPAAGQDPESLYGQVLEVCCHFLFCPSDERDGQRVSRMSLDLTAFK